MYCSNCGNKIDKEGIFCANCGTPINTPAQPQVVYYKQRVPGNGLSIAGMVLGIVGFVFALLYVLSFSSNAYLLERSIYRRYIFAYAFGTVLIPLALSATGLPLSICGLLKNKNGKNISGIILNSLTLLIQFILFLVIVTNYS